MRFVGSDAQAVCDIPGYDRVAEMVEVLPGTPYRQVVEMMAEASILLIINGEGFELEDAMPAKFFDYLPFTAPILSVGGVGGVQARVFAWSQSGTWAPSVAAIVDFIRQQYLLWKDTGQVRAPRNPAALEYFTQRRVAAECAEVFNAVVEARPVACHTHPPWENAEIEALL